MPSEYAALLHELLHDAARGPEYVRALIEPLVRAGRDQHLVRLIVRLVRDLAVSELIVAGDCVDRGPRGDRVIEYLAASPTCPSPGATTTRPGSAPPSARRR
jgi:fructose-1,6-bisphosphatase-3